MLDERGIENRVTSAGRELHDVRRMMCQGLYLPRPYVDRHQLGGLRTAPTIPENGNPFVVVQPADAVVGNMGGLEDPRARGEEAGHSLRTRRLDGIRAAGDDLQPGNVTL